MLIIGCDPGNVTGIAWWSSDFPKIRPTLSEVDSTLAGDYLRSLLDVAHTKTAIGCEKYVMMPGSRRTAQPAALMVMGMVEDIARQHGISVYYQLPSATKKLCPDALLHKVGWHTKTKDGHANDACRVLAATLADTDLALFADLFGV